VLTKNIEICGDGKKMGDLQCDDGNRNDGDGCDRDCNIEKDYNCTGGDENNPDICIGLMNFTIMVQFVDTFDKILLQFNKEIKQFKDYNSSILQSDEIVNMLAGFNVYMWNEQELRHPAYIYEAAILNSRTIQVKLSNVGAVCGIKNIWLDAINTNLTDIWNNTLNETGIQTIFNKKCYERILKLDMKNRELVHASKCFCNNFGMFNWYSYNYCSFYWKIKKYFFKYQIMKKDYYGN